MAMVAPPGRPLNWRRVRIVYVREDDIMLIGQFRTGGAFMLPDRISGVPADARIERVNYAWERKAFAIVISHESFDEVEEGHIIPPLDDEAHSVDLAMLTKRPDGLYEWTGSEPAAQSWRNRPSLI